MNRVLRLATRAPALALVLGAAGCAGRDASPPSDFRVALLLTGPVSDDGWNASAHEGLLRLERELGLEVHDVLVEQAVLAVEADFGPIIPVLHEHSLHWRGSLGAAASATRPLPPPPILARA